MSIQSHDRYGHDPSPWRDTRGPCGRVQIQGDDGKLHDAVWEPRSRCYYLPEHMPQKPGVYR